MICDFCTFYYAKTVIKVIFTKLYERNVDF